MHTRSQGTEMLCDQQVSKLINNLEADQSLWTDISYELLI